MENIC